MDVFGRASHLGAGLDAIRAVKLLQEGGRITAATSSQIADGASGVMVVNEKGLKALGVQPLLRDASIVPAGALAQAGIDPGVTDLIALA